MLPSANTAQSSNEELDEFDLEFDTNEPSNNAELIAKALENASIQAQSADVESVETKTKESTAARPEAETEPAVKQSASATIMEEARKALAEVAEFDQLHQLLGNPLAIRLFADAEAYVLRHAQVREQRVILKHHADPAFFRGQGKTGLGDNLLS